jgi:hypothetical protein
MKQSTLAKLHNFFGFLSTGGYSMLESKKGGTMSNHVRRSTIQPLTPVEIAGPNAPLTTLEIPADADFEEIKQAAQEVIDIYNDPKYADIEKAPAGGYVASLDGKSYSFIPAGILATRPR